MSENRRAFERTATAWVHMVSDDHMNHLTLHDTAESAMAYIEWDTSYYGPRNTNAHLKYRGSLPVYHHTDKGPITES
jgi:hypothetical protein